MESSLFFFLLQFICFQYSLSFLIPYVINFKCRKLEEWVTKDIADEVFMLAHQIEELVEILVSRNDTLPSSCSSLDGLTLTSILR